MLWLLKIIFNKRLRSFEVRKREKYQIDNFAFIDELKKLKLMKNILMQKSSQDPSIELFKLLDIDKAIHNVNSINFIIPYLFISDKDVSELQNHVAEIKKIVRKIVSSSRLIDKLDGFYTLAQESSIFSKITSVKTTACDSFN